MTTALIRRLADGDNSPDVFQWMAQAAKKYLRGETIDSALGLDEGRPGIVRNPRKNLLVDCYDTENQLS